MNEMREIYIFFFVQIYDKPNNIFFRPFEQHHFVFFDVYRSHEHYMVMWLSSTEPNVDWTRSIATLRAVVSPGRTLRYEGRATVCFFDRATVSPPYSIMDK